MPRLTRDVKLYLLGSTAMGAGFTFPFTLLAIHLDLWGASKTEIGWIASGSNWGSLLAALPAAVLVARLAVGRVLAASALACAVAWLILPWSGSEPTYFTWNLLGGLAWAVHFVAGAPLLFRATQPGERTAVFALAEAVRMGASVLGALLAGELAVALSERAGDSLRGHGLALTVAGFFPLLAMVAYAQIRDEGRARLHQPLLPRLIAHRELIARFAGPQLLISIGSGLTIPFMALYFTERFDFRSSDVGRLFAAGQVVMTLGFLAAPRLQRGLGYVNGIVAVQLASVPFFALLALTGSPELAAGAYLLRTGLMNASHPLLKAFLMETAPAGLHEVQNALLSFLWGLGWVIGPVLGGLVLEASHGDYAPLMFTTIALYLLGSGSFWFSVRSLEPERAIVPRLEPESGL